MLFSIYLINTSRVRNILFTFLDNTFYQVPNFMLIRIYSCITEKKIIDKLNLSA